jgi:hypothetical protein
VGGVIRVTGFGVVVSEWWSLVPVTVPVVGGCICGCGWWSGVVVCVVGSVYGGVVGGLGVVGDGGEVFGGVTVVVGRR